MKEFHARLYQFQMDYLKKASAVHGITIAEYIRKMVNEDLQKYQGVLNEIEEAKRRSLEKVR